MRIVRNWLVTMFDEVKRKERLFISAESAIEALQRAAESLELAQTRYEPCEVHVQLLTHDEAKSLGLVHQPTHSYPLPQAPQRKP